MKTVTSTSNKKSRSRSSLCVLCVLCVSVVDEFRATIHHRDTEDTEDAQRKTVWVFVVLTLAMLSFAGCNVRLPGQPAEAERWRAPADVSDFNQLYQENCAGCHGADGRRGVAQALNDSLYLSFVSDAAFKQVVAEGRAGTNMPAFSQKAGGSLTDKQIELLITGIRSKWATPNGFKVPEIPSYSANNGDPLKGAAAYQTYCASCHGEQGTGGSAGSIVDPNFLTMVSDQGLRTTVVVGRADLGKPDWRSNLPGRPMSAQEIADVVAWLSSQRQLNGER